MTAEQRQSALTGALATLQQNREALPWPDRRQLADLLGQALRTGNGQDGLLPLVNLLAEDPKPEVRQGIADLLPALADDAFAPLAARLSEDTNAFVRNAAQRAVDRRRRGQKEAGRKKRGIDQVLTDYSAMERDHGRAAAEKARRLGERLYDLLVGATVHDLRSVVTPAKANATSLLAHLDEGNADPKVLREGVVKIADRLEFMERLLEDVRSYSQPLPTQRSRTRLADMVVEGVGIVRDDMIAAQRDPAAVQLAVAIPEGVMLRAARHQLVVAFTNVIKNAYEALADSAGQFQGGQVDIRAELIADEVRITVRDTGQGLPPDELRDLRQFIPGRTTKKNRGTGFGLPIARRNVLAHGGTFDIDSVVEHGTTVTITLPLAQDAEEDE